MTDLQTLMVCVTLFGVAVLFYLERRRSAVAVADIRIDALAARVTATEAEINKRMDEEREANAVEFKEILTQFKRLESREAMEAFNQPRGNNARPY